MDYVRNSSVSTCFMYGGPGETKQAERGSNDEITEQYKELKSRIAAEEAAELEWERDVRYLLLELLEMLDEEVKDATHSNDDDASLERGFSRISKEYSRGVEALAQLYRRCKALLP